MQAVAGLARQLGLRAVAEGVEDEATLRAVAEWGATHAQGYYLSRPVPRRGAQHERLAGSSRLDLPGRGPIASRSRLFARPHARPALAALGALPLGHRRGDLVGAQAALQAARELRQRGPPTAAPSRSASGATSISERSRSIARTTAAATCSGVRVAT